MTPPDTNLKKQRRRHWPVIWGIAGTCILAVLAWIGLSGSPEDTPDPNPVAGTTAPEVGDAEQTGDTN